MAVSKKTPESKTLRIGSRGSRLALAQAGEVKRRLSSRYPEAHFKIVVVKTAGDEFQTVELFKRNLQGVFTKAIEKKLLRREVDIAVHSLKDLPTRLTRGLRLAAVTQRLDTSDVLISRARHNLSSLPPGAIVGTGSPRRKRQLALVRPDLDVRDIRGNLDTRVRKVLKERKFDAILVARAGLLRLRRYLKYARRIPQDVILPAVGQGALAIEARSADRAVLKMLRPLNHLDTQREVLAERNFLNVLGGGCRVPIGIYSKIKKGKLIMKAAVFSSRTDEVLRGQAQGPARSFGRLGAILARRLLKKGAKRFLKEARSA